MQWPWKEPGDKRHWFHATAGGDGIAPGDWVDAADMKSSGVSGRGGAWKAVAGLGISSRAMALLPVIDGVGEGAWLEYELEWKGEGAPDELVLQFLPDYRLYPGLRLRVAVSVNSSGESIQAWFSTVSPCEPWRISPMVRMDYSGLRLFIVK